MERQWMKIMGILGIIIITITQDIWMILIGIEIISITNYIITMEGGGKVVKGGIKYLIMNSISSGIIIIGIIIKGIWLGEILIILGIINKLGGYPNERWVIEIYKYQEKFII